MAKKLLHNTYLIWQFKPRLAIAQLLAGLWYRIKFISLIIAKIPLMLIVMMAMTICHFGNIALEFANEFPSDARYSRIFKICTRAFKNKLVRDKKLKIPSDY